MSEGPGSQSLHIDTNSDQVSLRLDENICPTRAGTSAHDANDHFVEMFKIQVVGPQTIRICRKLRTGTQISLGLSGQGPSPATSSTPGKFKYLCAIFDKKYSLEKIYARAGVW